MEESELANPLAPGPLWLNPWPRASFGYGYVPGGKAVPNNASAPGAPTAAPGPHTLASHGGARPPPFPAPPFRLFVARDAPGQNLPFPQPLLRVPPYHPSSQPWRTPPRTSAQLPSPPPTGIRVAAPRTSLQPTLPRPRSPSAPINARQEARPIAFPSTTNHSAGCPSDRRPRADTQLPGRNSRPAHHGSQ